MKLESRSIELRRVTLEDASDVEFIREMRNSFLDQKVYAVDHFIEPQEHQTWFASLDPTRDFFFVILEKSSGQRRGIVGCYQKNAPARSGEISIYLTPGNESLLLPFQAMALLLSFMFDDLKLDRAYGVFFKGNERALRFNAGFGFTPFEEDAETIKTELHASTFRNSLEKWRRYTSE